MSTEAQELEEREESQPEPKGKESRKTIDELPVDWRDYIRALRRENKEYREKMKAMQEELEKLRPLASKAEEIEKKYNAIIEKQKEKLLAKLPEDKREKYKNWDVLQLEEIVSDFLQEQEKRAESPGAVQGRPLPQKELSELTQEDLLEMRTTNPNLYYKTLQDLIKQNITVKQ